MKVEELFYKDMLTSFYKAHQYDAKVFAATRRMLAEMETQPQTEETELSPEEFLRSIEGTLDAKLYENIFKKPADREHINRLKQEWLEQVRGQRKI